MWFYSTYIWYLGISSEKALNNYSDGMMSSEKALNNYSDGMMCVMFVLYSSLPWNTFAESL